MDTIRTKVRRHRQESVRLRAAGGTAIGLPQGKVTVKDVARAAGVSITTVSRVLNNPGLVASDKQHAVQRALQSLDYIPNQLARSLISRQSKAIGLIVPTISNPVFAPTIEAIERKLDAAGYALLIHCCERDPEREFRQVRALIERGVDGLIITGSVHVPELAALLARNKVQWRRRSIISTRWGTVILPCCPAPSTIRRRSKIVSSAPLRGFGLFGWLCRRNGSRSRPITTAFRSGWSPDVC
jgi:transcriptional regulator with XRE-family HTH domain